MGGISVNYSLGELDRRRGIERQALRATGRAWRFDRVISISDDFCAREILDIDAFSVLNVPFMLKSWRGLLGLHCSTFSAVT